MKTILLISLFINVFSFCQTDTEILTLKELFYHSPTSLFDNTTEGIGDEEKDALLRSGVSDSWEIINETEDVIEIKCKFSNSKLILSRLNVNSESPMLIAYTVNEKATNLEFWEYDFEEEELKKIELLPMVKAKSFFVPSNKIKEISKYDNNVSYTLEIVGSKPVFFAKLNVWMEPAFENKRIDYVIELLWDSEKKEFETFKKAIRN